MAKNTHKRKAKIIDAAIEVLKEKSVEEATVREIAERAGVTTGSIYHYYKNKDELLYDVINHSIHFSYKISEMNESTTKNQEELLLEITDEIAQRLSKIDEQKLHILLLSDAISKGSEMKEKYKLNYDSIISKTADMYYFAFGIANETFKRALSAILVAALDGIAIQQSLDVLPEDQEKFIKTFNDFFSESIPLFLERHKENYVLE
jgi:AcrR family transcriptional regulator